MPPESMLASLNSDRPAGNILTTFYIQLNGRSATPTEPRHTTIRDWHMDCIDVMTAKANITNSETVKMNTKKRSNNRKSALASHGVSLSLRLLKKELKLIPMDLKREMRFLDLLLIELEHAKTQAEKDVIRDFLDASRARVEYHQKRLERHEECYRQLKETKGFDTSLLLPEELRRLQDNHEEVSSVETQESDLRTGTHG